MAAALHHHVVYGREHQHRYGDLVTTKLALVRENPWDRMDSETSMAFHGFTHYRDLGTERSIARAMQDHRDNCPEGKAREATWEEWSSRFEWVDRSVAWDRHLDGVQQKAFEGSFAEIGERHAAQAAAALEVLSRPAMELAKVLDESHVLANLSELAKTDATAFLAVVDLVKTLSASLPALAKMEREARGMGTGTEGTTGPETVRVVVKLDDGFRL